MRNDLGIVLSALRYLEDATGEKFDDEGGVVAQIERDLASPAPAPSTVGTPKQVAFPQTVEDWAFHEVGAVAAELVAWRWRNHVGDFDWSEWHPLQGQTPDEFRRQFANGFARGEFELQPLYASPPVRGDRETIIRLAEIHLGAWLKSSDPALQLIPTAARQDIRDFADAILSLQPGVGEK